MVRSLANRIFQLSEGRAAPAARGAARRASRAAVVAGGHELGLDGRQALGELRDPRRRPAHPNLRGGALPLDFVRRVADVLKICRIDVEF